MCMLNSQFVRYYIWKSNSIIVIYTTTLTNALKMSVSQKKTQCKSKIIHVTINTCEKNSMCKMYVVYSTHKKSVC